MAGCVIIPSMGAAAETTSTTPVLLELFTSEGCSSCPPADELLAAWINAGAVDGTPVICLGYHVDYWNNLGWNDPWSQPQFSARQASYNRALHSPSNYTPQLVVNGRAHEVGSNKAAISALVKRTSLQSLLSMAAAPSTDNRASWRITVKQGQGNSAKVSTGAQVGKKQAYEMWAVYVADRGESQVTRGENAGRHLLHRNIVVGLSLVADNLILQDDKPLTVNFTPIKPQGTTHLVFILQQSLSREIVAVDIF